MIPVISGERAPAWAGARLGNRIFSSNTTRLVARFIGSSDVRELNVPELGYSSKRWRRIDKLTRRRPLVIEGHNLDFKRISSDLEGSTHSHLLVRALGMRMEYIADGLSDWRKRVESIPLDVPVFDERSLVIHIRGDDAITRAHPNYYPLPVEFYKQILSTSGLRPVFVGQCESRNEYIRNLRQTFPNSTFINGTPVFDFLVVARARNKVISLSSFAWCAAWMGRADSRILQPLAGVFDPRARPDINLLPTGDSRFSFAQFPVVVRQPSQDLRSLLDDLMPFELPNFL